MYCWHCGERLSEEAEFCPMCGSVAVRPSGEPAGSESVAQEVHSLLAQANLLRMRKEWQAATLRCTEALRLFPGSASAHSLLGDICRDEGKLRDAMEWYRLALSIDPTRRADREKLDYLIDNVYGSNSKTEEQPDEEKQKEPSRTKKSLWFKYMTVFVVVMLFASVFTLLLFRSFPSNTQIESAAIVPETKVNRPQPSQPELRSRPEIVNPDSSPEPVIDATIAPVQNLDTDFQPPPAPQPEFGNTLQEIKPVEPKISESIATKEDYLTEALSESAYNYDSQSALLGAKLDPREQSVEVSFSMPQEYTLAETRARIFEMAVYLAKEASTQEADLKSVTIRSYLELEDEEGVRYELSFLGEANTESFSSLTANELFSLPADQIFSNIWWHPILIESQE